MTFPVSVEIVSGGLLITLDNGETEFHPSNLETENVIRRKGLGVML
jgi:hypothetical protein